jgi:hypothetical protein
VSDTEKLIGLWQQRLTTISTNANELSDAESTKRIRIKLRAGHYNGLTHARAESAITQLSTLLDDYLLLAKVVEEATRENQGGLFSSWTQREEKIRKLLEGDSITRTTEKVAIKNRDLLGSAAVSNTISPQDLLTVMQMEFEQARDTLNEIDQAEQSASKELTALRQDYNTMQERALKLHAASDQPSFIDIPYLQSDPLNAQEGKESLRRGLIAWSAKLDELEHARANAASEVLQAKAALSQLQNINACYDSAVKEASHMFGADGETRGIQAMAAQLDMLRSWCETLEGSLAAQQWAAVNVGASRLKLAINEALGNSNQALLMVRNKLIEAEDLKGRFTALKAKDSALNLAANPAKSDLRMQLEAGFKVRPLDMERLRAQLARYQEMLATA